MKTVCCKVVTSESDAAALTETLQRFADACNDLLAHARQLPKVHKFGLSHDHYARLKGEHGLNANYVVRVCDRVAESFGRGKRPVHIFKATSAVIDDKLFRYIEPTESVSIASTRGRLKLRLSIGDYQRRLLTGQRITHGTLCVRRGTFYVHLCVKTEAPALTGDKPLGVDLGINRIAVTSDGRMFSGRTLNRRRERYARTKASLQRKGTRGCKRLLKRLAGREARFQRDTNHVISKAIIADAQTNGQFVALEDLTGIRQRTLKHGRRARRILGRWAFYQLRQFIGYKADSAGVPVVLVDPAYTSRTCPYCGGHGHRVKHRFSCSCGFVGDADKVGAFNVAAQGAQAIRPKAA